MSDQISYYPITIELIEKNEENNTQELIASLYGYYYDMDYIYDYNLNLFDIFNMVRGNTEALYSILFDENGNVKIELFRIGDSDIAPHFEIVSQPNDWTKTIRATQDNADLTGMKLTDLNFWQGFNEYCAEHKNSFSTRKALPHHWCTFAIGSSECHIDLTVIKSGEIACALWIDNNKELYNKLFSNKESIENELGYKAIWDYKENSKASSISVVCEFKVDFKSEDLSYGYEWLLQKAEDFKRVFKKYL